MSNIDKKGEVDQAVSNPNLGVDTGLEIDLNSLYAERNTDEIEGAATRSYEKLTPEEREKVDKLAEELSKHLDPASISDFASSTITDMAKFSGSMFDKVKIGDMDGFKEAMLAFRKQLKSVDTKNLLPKKQEDSLISKIPFIGARIQASLDKKVDEYFQKTQTVGKFVDDTVSQLGKVGLTVSEDMKIASALKKKVYEYSKQLELLILAVARVKETLSQQADKMKAHANPNNLEEMSKISDVENAVTLLDRKLYDLCSFRVLSLNDIQRLTFVENANKAVGDKIYDIRTNVVPEWKKQIYIAYLAYRTYGATVVIEAVNKATADILVTGAKMTREAMTSSARAIEAPAITLETLKAVHEELKVTVDEVIKIEDNAKEMRKHAISEMHKLEKEIATSSARIPEMV